MKYKILFIFYFNYNSNRNIFFIKNVKKRLKKNLLDIVKELLNNMSDDSNISANDFFDKLKNKINYKSRDNIEFIRYFINKKFEIIKKDNKNLSTKDILVKIFTMIDLDGQLI